MLPFARVSVTPLCPTYELAAGSGTMGTGNKWRPKCALTSVRTGDAEGDRRASTVAKSAIVGIAYSGPSSTGASLNDNVRAVGTKTLATA
jgi:hypothetical protein